MLSQLCSFKIENTSQSYTFPAENLAPASANCSEGKKMRHIAVDL